MEDLRPSIHAHTVRDACRSKPSAIPYGDAGKCIASKASNAASICFVFSRIAGDKCLTNRNDDGALIPNLSHPNLHVFLKWIMRQDELIKIATVLTAGTVTSMA